MNDTLLSASQPTEPDNQDVGVQSQQQPQDPQQTAQKFLADDSGSFADGWRSLLPESIRDAKSLDSIKSLPALVNSYVNAQRMVGMNKVAVPGESATDEELGKVYDALGRPEKYSFSEEVKWDSDTQRSAVEKGFHDAGLNQRQADAMMGLYGSLIQEATGRIDQMRVESEASLRKEWGLSYDANITLANRALSQLGLDGVLAGNPVLNDAGFIRAMSAIGKGVGETRIGSAASAQAGNDRLDSILRDRNGAYYDASHPDHAKTVDEVSRLLAAKARE